jgi:hypothetical protein
VIKYSVKSVIMRLKDAMEEDLNVLKDVLMQK